MARLFLIGASSPDVVNCWYTRRMTSRPIGSVVGVIAGLAFVLINAGSVPGSPVWRVAAVLAAAAIVWFVIVRGPAVAHEPARREAIRAYGFAVTGMVVAIVLGASVISNVLDAPDAVPIWVVFCVGAHFWPFASAFALPVFRALAAALVLVALVGAVVVPFAPDDTTAGWTAVVAGFVLLAFSAAGPRLTRAL